MCRLDTGGGARRIVEVQQQQVQLTRHRDKGLGRFVVQVAGHAGAFVGCGEVAGARREPRVFNGLRELPGQALEVRNVVLGESVDALALDVQHADRPLADAQGHVELRACLPAGPET